MKLSLGADERLHVVETTLQYLQEKGHEVTWYGPEPGQTDPWPEVARCVAEDVAAGRADEGILFCWTGTGVSLAANKVRGVRAQLPTQSDRRCLPRTNPGFGRTPVRVPKFQAWSP